MATWAAAVEMPRYTPPRLSLIIAIDITNMFKRFVPRVRVVDTDWHWVRWSGTEPPASPDGLDGRGPWAPKPSRSSASTRRAHYTPQYEIARKSMTPLSHHRAFSTSSAHCSHP